MFKPTAGFAENKSRRNEFTFPSKCTESIIDESGIFGMAGCPKNKLQYKKLVSMFHQGRWPYSGHQSAKSEQTLLWT